MIQVASANEIEHVQTLMTIKKYLEQGYYVYVACKNNPYKAASYKRLQFIDIDEDLYFKPEETVSIRL